MKCRKCNEELNLDDNFCGKCGLLSAKGYTFYKNEENLKKLKNSFVIKQRKKISTLFSLFGLSILLLVVFWRIQGDDMFKPLFFIKKQYLNYSYGYNTSFTKIDNVYNDVEVNNLDSAYKLIKDDFDKQSWQCSNSIEVSMIEAKLENDYLIPSVSFCDMDYEIASKVENVIINFFDLFPNINGDLTNITLANAPNNSSFVAYFQPMYQFVNNLSDINYYNKVNKTQIILNSYYFLNKNFLNNELSNIVEDNWYVNDATWDSLIAHELGHYVVFKLFLLEQNIDSITFETKDNTDLINNALYKFDTGEFSKSIVYEAMNGYYNSYGEMLDEYTFALSISKYAGEKNQDNELIYDEVIAEAIHDYYLHGVNANTSSLEVINVIKSKFGEI